MSKSPEVSRISNFDHYLGESPLWSTEEQALFWINVEKEPELHRWHPESGNHKCWPMPRRIGGILLAPQGQLVVVLADGLYDFNPSCADLTLRCASPLPKQCSLHEAQCDRQGRLWTGAYDHDFNKQAAFLRLDGDSLTTVVPDISVANGLAFSPDGRTMYLTDAPTRKVEAFDLDPATGALSNRRTFFELKKEKGEGFADGAAMDVEGGYWIAAVGSGTLRRYLPDGTLDRVVPLPVSNPTKPAFGGPDMKTLYVTTTKLEIGADSEKNGGLYALEVGVAGIPEPVLGQSSS